MNPYDLVLHTLGRAEKSKNEITRATGVPFGVLGHALEVLIMEGKVLRVGLRYRLTLKGVKLYQDQIAMRNQ